MSPRGEFVAERLVVLRASEQVGLVSAVAGGEGAVRPRHAPLRRLVQRPVPPRAARKDPALALDDDVAHVRSCPAYQRNADTRLAGSPFTDGLGAGACLSPSAAGEDEPGIPIAARQELLGPRPQLAP